MIPTHDLAFFVDYYHLTMAQGFFYAQQHERRARFDYSFRSLPFDGGYAVFAGLGKLLPLLQDAFKFHPQQLRFLRQQGFKDEFLDYLASFKFKGDIYSVREGEVVFPHAPLLYVEGPLVECLLIETLLLNQLNFSTLIATKAARLRHAAEGRQVVEYGLRRAQSWGGLTASLSAWIGGVQGTSNVWAAYEYGIPLSGTMAHAWVQAFDSELEAFRTYANLYPDRCVLLVDTYDTLKSGLPNAIKVAKELESQGHRLQAIRLDSGDLAQLSIAARRLLDRNKLHYVRIAASNDLDEKLIRSLIAQGAKIDIFGIGTNLVTAKDSPALGGVYKLAAVDGQPRVKVSENIYKVNLPGSKKLLRWVDDAGHFRADGIILADEETPKKLYDPFLNDQTTELGRWMATEIQEQVLKSGKLLTTLPSIAESVEFAQNRLAQLPEPHKRFEYPHRYPVGISRNLQQLRSRLIRSRNH